ncbi:MAG: DUF523 domain-containing protein [Desulfovibrio sp.]
MERFRIAISRCLLGERVRYDGGARHAGAVVPALAREADFVRICPEVESGMPIPREPAEIGGTPFNPTFYCFGSGRNLTTRLMAWVWPRLELFDREPVHGLVLKSNSPSCAVVTPKRIYRRDGRSAGSSFGLFARAFCERFPSVPVADEVLLADPCRREEFMVRVRKYAAEQRSILHG